MTARAPQLETPPPRYAAPYTSPQPAAGECVICGEPAPHVPAAIDPDYAACRDVEACYQRAHAKREAERAAGEDAPEAPAAEAPAEAGEPAPVAAKPARPRPSQARKAALEKPPGE